MEGNARQRGGALTLGGTAVYPSPPVDSDHPIGGAEASEDFRLPALARMPSGTPFASWNGAANSTLPSAGPSSLLEHGAQGTPALGAPPSQAGAAAPLGWHSSLALASPMSSLAPSGGPQTRLLNGELYLSDLLKGQWAWLLCMIALSVSQTSSTEI